MINKKTDSDVNADPRVGYQDFWKSLWPDPEPSAAGTSNKSAISVDSSIDSATYSTGQDAWNIFNSRGVTGQELDVKFIEKLLII